MLKLRAEIDGKIYDTETAKVVKAGWKAISSHAWVSAGRFIEEGVHFSVELGSSSHIANQPFAPDTSRITLIPQDADWELYRGLPDISKEVRAYFGKED
jgi:hypothetical protein